MAALRAALQEEGGLLADALAPSTQADASLGAFVAAGPRAAGREAELALVVEAIREGELLHYGRPRLFDGIEPDLALLAGDRLYAFGLARLAALGDLVAVAELADVIALCAQTRAEGQPERADAIWEAGVAAIGWGSSPQLAAAKEALREGADGAEQALRDATRQLAGDAGPTR